MVTHWKWGSGWGRFSNLRARSPAPCFASFGFLKSFDRSNISRCSSRVGCSQRTVLRSGATMNADTIPETWLYQVFQGEDSSDRFEDFAIATASVLEGRALVRTSKTWDRGRDGRSATAGQDVFVLASLRRDLKKPVEDATRLKATTQRIRRVYLYLSDALTEHFLDEATAEIRKVLGDGPEIESYGAHQLVHLIQQGKIEKQFRDLYASDLTSLRFASNPATDSPQLNHLWLALATFESEDVQSVRRELLECTILALLLPGAASVPELIQLATKKYGCTLFSEAACGDALAVLIGKDHVLEVGFRWQITQAGRDRLTALTASTQAGELKGSHAVRTSVETSLGHALPEQQWAQLWMALQREFADVLYTRGRQFVDTVSKLVASNIDTLARDSFADLLDRGIRKAVKETIAPVQVDRVVQAVQDAFLPGSPSGAFDFLADIAAKFIALCTLGITAEVAGSIENVLASVIG